MVAALDHLAPQPLLANAGGPAAAGSVQAEPVTAVAQPPADELVLLVIRERSRHVRDQEAGTLPPLLDVGEVVRDRRPDVWALLQQLEDPQACVVHVVRGRGARRKPAGDDVHSNGIGVAHCLCSHN